MHFLSFYTSPYSYHESNSQLECVTQAPSVAGRDSFLFHAMASAAHPNCVYDHLSS